VSPDGRRVVARILPLLTVLIITCFLTNTSADADLWGHLTFGRDIVQSRAVHASDPYSFTSDRPWVNHEWLAEAIMWVSYHWAGSTGLIALKLLLAWCAGGLLLSTWRPFQLTPIKRDTLLFATALCVWPSLATARPQMFSLVLFGALLSVLSRARDGELRLLAFVPAIFLIWVNTHGGWIVGAGALAVFTACSVLDGNTTGAVRRAILATCLASTLAVFVNPYGAGMLAFLLDTVRPDRADIVEWQSVFQSPPIVLVLWLVPASVAAAAIWRGRRAVPIAGIAVTLMLAVASLRVIRLVSFFALAVGFLVAPYVWARQGASSASRRSTFRDVRMAALSFVPIAALSIALFGRRITMDGQWLPEPEAATFVSTRHLHGNMLTWFDYGEYAIWHFSPSIRVSLDGRRETVFSEDIRAAHARIYSNAPSALDEVARLNPDYVWLPIDTPVFQRLRDAGWSPIFRGDRSAILAQSHSTVIPDAVVIADRSRRSFPGP
jgi:hypothetical protein